MTGRRGDSIGPSGLTVNPLAGRADRRAFLSVPRAVYARDENWVEPLAMERRQQWSARHPWFEHAEAVAFLARDGGRPVGTISAQIDRRQPASPDGPVGYFGQFESVDEPAVVDALLGAAGAWLRERGCAVMRGPFDLNINQACGLLVDGFDTPPMVMMGHARPYYAERLQQAGLAPVMDLYAYLLPPDFAAPPAMSRLLTRLGDRIRFRTMDFGRYQDELQLMQSLFNSAWSANWGFVPMSEAEFQHMGKALRQVIRPEYTCIAEVDGEPAGFIVALPNINELIADLGGRLLPLGWARLLWRIKQCKARSARVPLMGVRPAYQRGPSGAAISFGMIDRVRRALHADGVERVEVSWILQSNQGMNSMIEAMGGDRYKCYRLFERRLA